MERHSIVAYNIGREMDLRALSKEYLRLRVRISWEEPLELECDGRQVLVYSFGSFVILDPREDAVRRALEILRKYTREPLEPCTEEYELIAVDSLEELEGEVGREDLKEIGRRGILTTDVACIVVGRPLTKDIVKTVAFVLAQSSALDRIERDVDAALDKAQRLLESFERGSLFFRLKPTMRELISVLRTRFNAISDVMVLSKPEIAWENPELDELYEELRRIFEIDERFEAIDKALGDILEMCQMLSDLVSASRETILEAAILLLIAVEIAIAFLEFLLLR